MFQDYILDTLIYIGIYGILAISLNLEAGYTRLMNFGKVAFFAIGAYASALLSIAGAPFLAGLVVGILLSAMFGFLVALPALRLRADYLAIVTLSFGEILRLFFLNEQWLTNGPMGLRGIPQPLFSVLDNNYLVFYTVMVFVFLIICYAFSEKIMNSPFGITLKAIRDDEDAVFAFGEDTFRFKVKVFIIGSAMAGISGALFAHYIAFISPDMFFPSLTFSVWTMMVIGGSANNLGVIAGAFLIQFLERGTRFIKDFADLGIEPSNLRIIIIGILLILFILYKPEGIIKERKRIL
ncbi:MAG: branched-chain amino acid ABC transporter permease [Candidatus Methanoperedenaceae archaeon]|nr:MAG: branched-chain amino acid ABC transporter permease [Candidatus Methanoperedenaceae archaeon]